MHFELLQSPNNIYITMVTHPFQAQLNALAYGEHSSPLVDIPFTLQAIYMTIIVPIVSVTFTCLKTHNIFSGLIEYVIPFFQ